MSAIKSGAIPALKSWQLRALTLSVLFGALGYLGISVWVGWDEMLEGLTRIGWTGLCVLLILSLLNYLIRFVRWQYYLSLMGHRVPWKRSLRIYIAGFSLTTTPGKAGEALRSLFLKPEGVRYTQSLAALFSERLSDLMAILALTSLGVAIYPPARPMAFLLLGIMAVTLIILRKNSWLRWLEGKGNRLLPMRIAELFAALMETIIHSGQHFRNRAFAVGILLALAAWGAEAIGVFYISEKLNLNIPLQAALFIYAFSMLIGAISFLPGGLGSAEVTMVVLLLLYGVPEPLAASITIVVRLATLWFAVLLGLAALSGLHPAADKTEPHELHRG